MPAKMSAEMKKAIKLIERGISVYEAARKAGVTASNIYKYLKNKSLKTAKNTA